MTKWLIPVLLVTAGACVFAGGLLYGVFTVGVPTPDAAPAVAAREARDSDTAGVLMAAGLVVGVAGVAALAGVAATQVARRRATAAEPGATADRGRRGGPG